MRILHGANIFSWLTGSIQRRLLGYCALYVALLLGVASFGFVQMASIENTTRTLNRTSLPGTSILANLKRQLDAFHHAESMLLFDMGMHAQQQGGALLSDTERSLRELVERFGSLALTPRERQELGRFREHLNAYLEGHEAWAARRAAGAAASAAVESQRLERLHETAADALKALNATSTSKWRSGAASAATAATWMLRIFAGMVVAGLLLAGWLMFEINARIARPIATITRALSALAAGDTQARIPGAARNDEIGLMAKALEVFRNNVWALEQAHRETEEAHRRAEAMARHDVLTGLPNRRLFSEELERAVAVARHGSAVYLVLLLDLDRFKSVNDSHGHPAGDMVLCEIAERLVRVVGESRNVARLGGDEFAAIVALDGGPNDVMPAAIRIANHIIHALSEPVTVGESCVEIGVSIGAAYCPSDGDSAEELLRAADIAMYRAKNEGRGVVRFFERFMDRELTERAQLEADLRRAVRNGEIEPHYQPIVSIGDGRLLGYEILARWRHGSKGLLGPSAFIPLAEETGLIRDLTFQILRRACRDASTWPHDLLLSLNLSPLQLQDEHLPIQIMAILWETDFPPRRLEIEITETALVADIEQAKSVLSALQGLGIRISLDDFGTGYSSLYHLRELHLDKIKIDKSFVMSMGDPESRKIVHAILGLSRSLGLPTVAEGIEDAGLLDILTECGCELGQGYYFGKPMPAGEARARALDVDTPLATGKAMAQRA